MTDHSEGPITEAEGGQTGSIDIVAPETTDADAIVECWLDLAREQRAFGSDLASEDNREAIHATILTHTVAEEVFIARDPEDGQEVIGFVTFEADTGRYEETVERGIVHNLYVRPEYRDRGIGSRLLGRAERALADRGVEAVTLEAMADNEAARRFYDRAAYEPHRVTLRKSLESDTHSKE